MQGITRIRPGLVLWDLKFSLELGSWVLLKSGWGGIPEWEEGIQAQPILPQLPKQRGPAGVAQFDEYFICTSLTAGFFLNKICSGLKFKPVQKGKARAAFLFLKDKIKCINCWNRCVCPAHPKLLAAFCVCVCDTLNLHIQTSWKRWMIICISLKSLEGEKKIYLFKTPI